VTDLTSTAAGDETLENGDIRSSVGKFVLFVVCLIVAVLLLANDTWTAVQNIATVPPLITKNYDFYRANGLTGLVKPVPWPQLIIALVTPALGLAAALWLGRRRSIGRRLLLLLVAVCAVSAVAASVSAYITVTYQL
jgi:hypothetical protein